VREPVDGPPHREVDRQRQRDDLAVFLIEEGNSLQHEAEQREQCDQPGNL